ncbi:protein NLRC5 isoform X8 [Dermochelys coriacea]|uniref:protein NLRC5 isoform X8 n=1 Tax=Dermochelys coriacea TaxID=27794 RepID=UPI001CA7CEBA|nr:protein NLRC5 isoform X8 [Dermochelys coriacea]XP_043351162.1 protein NLRC5 isoform X8 [Dermochelys coriacea]
MLPQMEDMDLQRAIANAQPQLVESLSHTPEWLLMKAKGFLPHMDLSHVDEITDCKKKVLLLLDTLENAGPIIWKQFIQCVCMEGNLPMDLEIQLMSASGEGNLNQEQEGFAEASTQSPSQPTGHERHGHGSNSHPNEKESKRQRLDSTERYRHLIIASMCQRYGNERAAGTAVLGQVQAPAFSQAFVNLVIRQSKASRLKEKADKPREDLAGMQEAEECVDTAVKVSDLFESVVSLGTTKVILLFGKPGMGKTMLMHRLCQKWAEGALHQFLFTFLFEFRQLNLISRKLTLKELLFDLLLQPEDCPDAVFQHLLENAQRMLFIFDGLDEFVGNIGQPSSPCLSPALHKPMSISELFANLCFGKLLPGCTVLVTSRPKKLPDFLLNRADLLAEIWGFDREKVEEYASHYFHQHSFKEQAIAHLKNNSKLLSMCLIPALCCIVCVCLEYLLRKRLSKVELPQTMTQFYIKMLLIFISKQQTEGTVSEDTQLNHHRTAILGLCDLALKGLEEKKLVFYVDDIPKHVKEFASLHGLLTVFEVKRSDSLPEAGHAFVHLSLQEFFAALNLMINNSVDGSYLKKKFSLKSKWTLKSEARTEFMENFHIFLSGLSSKECRTFLTLLAEQNQAWVRDKQATILQSLKKLAATNLTGPKIIELCHCTYETQDLELAKHVGSQLNFKYEFRNFRLTPLDVSALVFIINCGQDLTHLDFAGCPMELDCLEVLTSCKNIEHLRLTGGSITALGLTGLAQVFPNCLQLEEINLQDNRLRDQDMGKMIEMLSRVEKLKMIDLSHNDISVKSVLTLAKGATTCPNVTELHIRKDTIVIYFSGQSREVPRSPNLRRRARKKENATQINMKLRLQDCSFNSQHAVAITALLRGCAHLSEVDLSGNQLGDEGCRELVESLPKVHISKRLDVSNNQISVDGVCCLLNAMNTCLNAVEFEASLHHQTAILKFIGDKEFPSTLSRDTSRSGDQSGGGESQKSVVSRKIRLTDSGFPPRDLDKLCTVLKKCSSVSELDLSNNSLGDQGVGKLVGLLPELKAVSFLKLSGNQISLSAVFGLAQCLSALEHIKSIDISLGNAQSVHLIFWESVRNSRTRSAGKFQAHPRQLENDHCFRLRECTVSPKDMDRLCQILEKCTGLTELELSRNALSDQSIERLLMSLPNLHNLKLLSIRNNKFSPNCTLLLANSLNLCERIREVEVRSSENTSLHLAGMIESQETSCRLTDCSIGQNEVEELCRILEQCGRLAELDLSGNQLGNEGLRRFLDHLLQMHVSRLLNLSHNKISQDGVLYLINTLSTCRNVTEVQVSLCSKATSLIKFTREDEPRKILRLTECNFQPEHLPKLFSLLQKCTNLTAYISTNNNMTTKAVEDLLRALRKSLGTLRISIAEPWVRNESIASLLQMAVQPHGNVIEITISKDKGLLRVGVGFPCRTEKMESVVSRLNQCGLEAKHIHFLQRVIEKCTQLQELSWSHIDLNDAEEAMLASAFLTFPTLRKFELMSSSVTPSGMGHLVARLQQCHAIEELNLCSLRLDDTAILMLVPGLHKMPLLKRLLLNNNSIGNEGCSHLAEALKNAPHMEEINLSHNKIEHVGLEKIAKLLPEMQNLKIVNLSSNSIGPAGGETLVEALAHCRHVEELLLARNHVGDKTAARLSLSLPSMGHLKILHLQSNNIGSLGGMPLAKGLVECQQLEEISLSENGFGEGALRTLSEGLPRFTRLRKIELKFCGISDGVSKHLALGFSRCPVIEEIILSWNSLGDEGALELATVLPRMARLRILDLDKNRIAAQGAKKLAEELAKCCGIQVIRLWSNPVPKNIEESLTKQDARLHFSFF